MGREKNIFKCYIMNSIIFSLRRLLKIFHSFLSRRNRELRTRWLDEKLEVC